MGITKEQLREAADFIRKYNHFLLVPHERADGDALGSVLALSQAMKRHGKDARAVMLTELSERYQFLGEENTLTIFDKDKDLSSIEAIIVIDTGASQQLVSFMPTLEKWTGGLMVIDHHSYCDLKPEVALRDEHSPATGLIIGQLLEEMGWLDEAKIADDLFIAIVSDTGWFSYSNTNADCYAWAARLTSLGANDRKIYENLFLSDSPARFRLIARALSSAELRSENRLIVLTLRQKDFIDAQACEAHTENIIDQACRIKTMVAAILFVEQPSGIVRVSLRSREPFDVHAFAHQFGGGGHPRAAGMRIKGNFDEVRQSVIAKLEAAVEQS
jgi:phosphoesterase RecJ-like protein